MNKDVFFSSSTVKNFLNKLSYYLKSLPNDDRYRHIEEIKSELYEYALELDASKSVNDREIPEDVVNNFAPPKVIADEITEEYKDELGYYHKSNNNLIKYYTVFSIATLGGLSLPILFGEMNISSSLPLILFFLGSNIWFVSNRKILWNHHLLHYFQKMIRFCASALVALPLAFFAIRIIITSKIELFTLNYLIAYLTVTGCYLFFLAMMYRRNKQD
ncbi:hypothetical protein AAV35_000645 [Salimicrobium jeotgali]|uniref:Uncharacterized protein n=1 Tax=Salimicrobium jeotgali TaxID=1230341 RepID=K2G6C4_9BACI|nr:DUF1700 domain-containing protein [Salimicrobium jeotgali]AKG03432.1 hypothetical protein AAV35_000645 [Salimicrobium jeotgali]EKE30733.1 hypothetical protein MJ3_12225 [Salimicrobium jeotgali]MBM7697138.1 putative membrane protein [Salimicrobium jeotgali]